MVGWSKRTRARPWCGRLEMTWTIPPSACDLLVGSDLLVRRYVGCLAFGLGWSIGLEMWLPFWVYVIVVDCVRVGVDSFSMGLTCNRMLRELACFM